MLVLPMILNNKATKDMMARSSGKTHEDNKYA
jgi:hypothetical protein